MSPKWIKKHLPQPERLMANRWLAWLGPVLHRHDLWQLHRRNVARSVAIGLFCGLMPGPTQMLSAGLMAVLLKANLPLALFTTLYTNPLTIVPLYLLAFEYGRLITGANGGYVAPPPELGGQGLLAWGEQVGQWMLSLGAPLAVGVLALGLTLAFVGYFITDYGWRLHVRHAWKKRKSSRGSH